MIKKFWTITQKEEIEKYCFEYGIPQDIIAEIFRIIHILDENYGVDRALESDGGYVALLVEENCTITVQHGVSCALHLLPIRYFRGTES